MEKICLIYTTFATQDDAVEVLRELIDGGHAACGNISLPHSAVYPWKGKLAKEQEVAVHIKAPASGKAALIKKLQKIHPYELPCIIELEASATADYADWLANP